MADNNQLEDIITEEELKEPEVKYLLKNLESGKPNIGNTYDLPVGGRRLRCGIMGDTHIGSKYFNYEAYHNSLKVLSQKNIEFIIHGGDFIEGMSNREGHIYELEHIGVSEQLDKAKELMSAYQKPIYFILGNHDLWSMKKSNQGVNIGTELESILPSGSKYLGDEKATLTINNKIDIEIAHAGSSAYALSYSLQKLINAMNPDYQPDVLLQPHIHKAGYIYYRNIHALMTGTLQDQTPFMRMKGSPSHVGFWTLDLKYNKNGITQFSPTFYPTTSKTKI